MKYIIVIISMVGAFAIIYAEEYDEIKISTTSEEAKLLYINARDLSENMQFAQAIILINKALKIDPKFALAYLLKARQINNLDEQEFNLRRAEKFCSYATEGERFLIHYFNGVFDNNHQTQQKYLNKLTEIFPGDKRVQIIAASEKYLAGDLTMALEHLRRALELDPFYYPAYNLLGYCKAGLSEMKEPDKVFESYFTMQPYGSFKHDFIYSIFSKNTLIENRIVKI